MKTTKKEKLTSKIPIKLLYFGIVCRLLPPFWRVGVGFLVCVLPLLRGAGVASAQNITCSTATGSPNPDFGYALKQIADDVFLVGGYTNTSSGYWNAQINKIDTNCTVLSTQILSTNKDEKVFDMLVTQSKDEYLFVGDSYDIVYATNDAMFLRTDSSGNILTRTYIGGTGNEIFYSVTENDDSTYTAVGLTSSFGSISEDYYIVKLAKNGNVLWQKQYGGAAKEIAMGIDKTTDGGYYVTGFTLSFGMGGRDIWTMKLNNNGDTLWAKTYGGIQDDTGYEVKTTEDGGAIVVGYTTSFGNGGDAIVIKIDSLGNTEWQKNYGGFWQEQGFSIKQDNDGSYIFTGNKTIAGNKDVWLVKLNTLGDTLWTRTYGGINTDNVEQVIITNQGNYALAGNTQSFGSGMDDFYFLYVSDTTNNLITDLEENNLQNNHVVASIYPNPTNGNFTIELQTLVFGLPTLITITDLQGKVVFENSTSKNKISGTFSNHPKGMYLIKIQTEEKVIISKIIYE